MAGRARIAGVSSFGFSGTNAHVLLEQPPVPTAGTGPAQPSGLLTLSARTEAALRDHVRHFAVVARTVDADDVEAMCATANLGRDSFEYRLAVVAGSGSALAAGLDSYSNGAPHPAVTA
ncbi:MAG: ketoacyl-synthetase C-terminal extension domain-containing protein [Stackebrandtia sp.]